MHKPFRRIAIRVLPFTSFIAGCGVETYQARVLENTVPLFRYKEELDANLGPEWHKGEVSLRLPVGMTEIPGPKKDTDQERRLPSDLASEMPGVLGGFRGKADALTSGGQNAKADTHVLVLSNRALLASRKPDSKPSDYDKLVVNSLAAAVGQGTSSGSLGLKRVEIGGGSRDRGEFGSMPPQVQYETAQFELMRGDVPMRYEVYFRRSPPLIVAVVFLVPREPARSEHLRERIDLSLQTLRIDQPGSVSSAPSGGGGGSGGGAPGF